MRPGSFTLDARVGVDVVYAPLIHSRYKKNVWRLVILKGGLLVIDGTRRVALLLYKDFTVLCFDVCLFV